jgi:hypothetical protein
VTRNPATNFRTTGAPWNEILVIDLVRELGFAAL